MISEVSKIVVAAFVVESVLLGFSAQYPRCSQGANMG